MALRIHRRLWQFSAVAIFAAAIAAGWIRSEHSAERPRSKESMPYWEAADRENFEYLRLRDEYDRRLNELQAAGEQHAWRLATPARAKMEEQQKKWSDARDKAQQFSK